MLGSALADTQPTANNTMYNINRRQFLQFASSVLATIGASQLDILQQSEKYGKVLAQSTSRKIALLVGINKYGDGLPELAGCVNDVSLQRELLIHRFGFNPKDILTLTDAQATRSGILAAFEEHLIKQAKPGDVVVFHYSGHGDRVSDKPSCDEVALRLSTDCANSSFCPVDARTSGAVRDIMGHTLFLLMSALKTENVTAVLDSCYSGGGKRGNYRVRSVSTDNVPSPSAEELEYQRSWLTKLNLSPQEFIDRRRKGIAKGVVIAAGRRDQQVLDASFNDFSAGAFTYLFTQYLWQQTGDESLKRSIVNVSRSTDSYANAKKGLNQNPEFESNLSQKKSNPLMYFAPFTTTAADAVVTNVSGNMVDLWMGGIDTQVLEAFQKDAIFTVVDTKGGETLVQLTERTGLTGRGKLISANQSPTTQIQSGALLEERIRSIPSDLTLKIGLDDTTLDSNLTQQAKQLFQAIKRIEPLNLGTSEVQYIFGRMTQPKYDSLQAQKVSKLPPVGSFGLFLPTSQDILPNSFGSSNESITNAVTRLQPKLKSLLAARIVKQMLGNTNTSRVKVTASMQNASSNKLLAETFPVHGFKKETNGGNQIKKSIIASDDITKLSLLTEIVFQVRNDESVPLYVSILVIDAAGDMTIIFPNDYSASESAALIGAGQRIIIPQAGVDGFKLTVSEPVGFTEALIIASTTPLRDSLKALKNIAASRGMKQRGPIGVADDELLNVTTTLLDDLDRGTRGGITSQSVALPQGVRGVDVQKLAAMSITFEVI